MRFRFLFCCVLMCSPALVAGQVESAPVSTAGATEIPHLRKQGTATQLIVDGKPFLALAGELSNSSATSADYMKLVWERLALQTGSTPSWRAFPGTRSNPRKESSISACWTA